MERIPLQNGGCLELREQGLMVELTAWRALDHSGIYKVWLRGAGPDFLLGTLLPEGGQLRLRRTLSRDTLLQAGCWPVRSGRVGLAHGLNTPQGWTRVERPGDGFPDPQLRDCLNAHGPMLSRPLGDGIQLAAPFHCGKPFPVTILFCFSKITQICDQLYTVYSFDAHKNVKLP